MSPPHRSREEFRFDARYGRLIRKAGIGTIPYALFYYQAELDLTPQEVWLIGYVLSHRWTSELPFPAVREMARRSGVTTKTLEKYKKSLEDKGYLCVVRRTRADGGNTSIGWDFSPLFERIDRLITRDAEHWIKRNPQFLEEEFPELADDAGDNAVDKPGPVLRGYHGPVTRGSHGSVGLTYDGAGGEGSHAPPDKGRTACEEDYLEEDESSDTREEGNRDERSLRTATFSNSKATASPYPRFAGGSSTRGVPSPPGAALVERIVRDYSARLHDAPKSVRSNCTRACRLWEESGLALDDFVGLLHQAYERTEENSHRIRKSAGAGPYGTKNKMPYFFSVLAGLLANGEARE